MNKIETNQAPEAIGPYSQAIETGNTLYISGQIPLVPETMLFNSDDVALQTEQCLKNLLAILTAASYSFNDVVKCTIFLIDMNDFNAVNDIYAHFFNTHQPARACVEVSRLPRDAKVEIEAIAVKTN